MAHQENRRGTAGSSQGQRSHDTTRGGGYERGGDSGGQFRGGHTGPGQQSGNQPNRGQGKSQTGTDTERGRRRPEEEDEESESREGERWTDITDADEDA